MNIPSPQTFTEPSLRLGFITTHFSEIDTGIEIFGGVKNLDQCLSGRFDWGKNGLVLRLCPGPQETRFYRD